MRHDRAIRKSRFIFRQGFHFDEANAAVRQGVIVVIAMGLLDDHFVLQARHVRWAYCVACSCWPRSCRRRCPGLRRRRRRPSPWRPRSASAWRGIRRPWLQLNQPDGMFSRAGDGGLHRRRHGGGRENGVGSGGIDDLGDAELVVVILAFVIRRVGAGAALTGTAWLATPAASNPLDQAKKSLRLVNRLMARSSVVSSMILQTLVEFHDGACSGLRLAD